MPQNTYTLLHAIDVVLLKDDRIDLDMRRSTTRKARAKLRYTDQNRKILGEKYTLLIASFWQNFFCCAAVLQSRSAFLYRLGKNGLNKGKERESGQKLWV